MARIITIDNIRLQRRFPGSGVATPALVVEECDATAADTPADTADTPADIAFASDEKKRLVVTIVRKAPRLSYKYCYNQCTGTSFYGCDLPDRVHSDMKHARRQDVTGLTACSSNESSRHPAQISRTIPRTSPKLPQAEQKLPAAEDVMSLNGAGVTTITARSEPDHSSNWDEWSWNKLETSMSGARVDTLAGLPF